MKTFLKLTRGWKLPLVALIGLVFAMVTVLGRPAQTKTEPLTMPPRSEYDSAVAGIGVVEPRSEIIAIGTELSGIVRAVHVKVGAQVKAGDPLFTLDQRDINAQIKTLESALESVKIEAEDAEDRLDIIQSIKDKRAVSRDDKNRRKFAAALSQARIAETQAQLDQARMTKERLTVRAPIDGEVLSVNVRPGEFASMGATEEPLIRMGDTSVLHVRVEIDEENINRIDAKAAAKGIKRGDTATQIPLQFVRYEPFVRPKQNLAAAGQRVDTRVLQVIYAIKSPDRNTFVGEQMDVFIDSQ